ncbi:Cysteine-rich secretory protein family protein [Corynebacterium faecale]|uniref:CAP domain-containing protein n=1 Tax=Corynebacterium faecale TaxID=1758466 RepID=UPI0025B5B792|nr:CAP domain-containing protein [Corynebacterium faecale]WJY92869.1 Cysteine-rich secretory protein family protein [Corynebacterium faecale]
MFQFTTKKLGALAATTIIAATAIQGVVAAPAQAFSSSGFGTTVMQDAAPYAGTTQVSADARYVLDLINAYRAENGLRPVALDGGFANGAGQWAQYLADSGMGPHHPEGGNFWEAVAYANSAEQAMQSWKNSPPHNRILLESQISHGAVGLAVRPNGQQVFVFRGLWEPANATNSKGHPGW